ncbi:MAG: hypothetical protein HXX15_08635 [Rhodopseudomonas sp.]|nr:hypothetical protein [Rhodopseudomonas sp.]
MQPAGSDGWGGGARAAVAAVLLLAGIGLGGCSISLSDLPLGSSDETRAKEPDAFPAVNDLPTGREETAMAPAERTKIESELIAARERQAAVAAAPPPPAKK